MIKRFFTMFCLLNLAGCAWFQNRTNGLALSAAAKEDIKNIVLSLNMLKTEIRYDYEKGRNVSKGIISGQPFGFLPWNVGKVNERKFFIEVGELSYLQCEGLLESKTEAVSVSVNGIPDGWCDNENVIRWIFKR